VAILEERIMATKPTADDAKPQPNVQFIPKLRGKKITIRMTSGGQPIIGTLEAYNPYELLIRTAKGSTVIFKHAIATIEVMEETGGYRPDSW
jgi:sRNA-binding regulator protein Hfq